MTKPKAKLIAPPSKGPRILLYDIETAPALAWVWQNFKTNVIATEQDWYMLSFAYKWWGQEEIGFVSVKQDKDWKPPSTDDYRVVEALHRLMDQADATVAHNGDKFDLKKANARFLYHGLGPVTPMINIDTRKEARRYFGFLSNSLNELCRTLGLGRKLPTQGFDTWEGAMVGDKEAWRIMEKYNRHDVVLLEKLYEKLLPWIGSPGKLGGLNVAHWANEGEMACPKCGHDKLIKRGTHRSRFSEWQTWQCSKRTGGCGGYSRGRSRKPQRHGGVRLV